jgi:signal transduction histidine kinase
MRFRTWPVAALGLVGLLALILFAGLVTDQRTQEIYARLDQLNAQHRDVDARLRRLRSDVHSSGLYVRDYLLDAERARDPEYRTQLAAFRRNSLATVEELAAVLPTSEGQAQAVTLRASLDAYWGAFDPLFYWTSAEKITRSAAFLRTEVLPRREAALALARDIEALNNATLDSQSREVTAQYDRYRVDLRSLLWQTIGLGVLVAVVAVNRLRVLERRADEQRAFAEAAEQRMRTLSQQLVAAQEEERRHLSRELHDHVGQQLTGLRMTLGRVERGSADSAARSAAVSDGRAIVDDIMRTVRDLALGLRPSMLDDLGLQPALEWLVRDFSRRAGIAVSLAVDGALEPLPDGCRTTVYRVVQEGLTNVARHAQASRVDVHVRRSPSTLSVTVHDNGVGLSSPSSSGSGIGLRGIEERVRERGGTMVVKGGPEGGVMLVVELPVEGSPHARLAG